VVKASLLGTYITKVGICSELTLNVEEKYSWQVAFTHPNE